MKIQAISDLHGSEPELPESDLLIIAGDCTAHDYANEWKRFAEYVNAQPAKWIILVAGNHDGALQNYKQEVLSHFDSRVVYLQDSEIAYENLKIWGTPWTVPFYDWNFMADSRRRRIFFDQIPEDTDILISHGPAYGILDETKRGNGGCPELRHSLASICPKIHIFGHIHEQSGQQSVDWGEKVTECYNVSYLDELYDVKGVPPLIEIP